MTGSLWALHEQHVDRGRTSWDPRPLVALIGGAVLLTVEEYFSTGRFFRRLDLVPEALRRGPEGELWALVYATGARALVFVLVPLALLALSRGGRPRDALGSPRGLLAGPGPTLALVAAALPFLTFMARFDLERVSTVSTLTWQLLMFAQLLALEVFFRGFMTSAVRRSFGVHSAWMVAVPASMIYYRSSLEVALAAIAASIILGILALRVRSIWGGVLAQLLAVLLAGLLGGGRP